VTEIWNALLVYPLLNLLVGAYNVFRDYGVAIVAVTVGIRLLLYPLVLAQIRSQRAMQELAPAMAELKKRHGNDRQRLAQEQMSLYKERGYNPAMGCLPLLIQLPILFAFFAALDQAPRLNGAAMTGILWPFIENPLQPDQPLDMRTSLLPWLAEGLARPDPVFIIPILAGLTQLVASVMAQPADQPPTDDPQQRMFRSMAYYMPVITVIFAWGLPSGLGVYWVASTIFQIFQQYFVTGWGELSRFLPFLRRIPTPADADMRRRRELAEQTAAVTADRAERASEGEARASDNGKRKAVAAGGRRRGSKRRRR
jgi:YidC/Oxa1 family membrane protein insertase